MVAEAADPWGVVMRVESVALDWDENKEWLSCSEAGEGAGDEDEAEDEDDDSESEAEMDEQEGTLGTGASAAGGLTGSSGWDGDWECCKCGKRAEARS